ncbi:MAG: YfhO family protein, partial [bacterium]|nr:YfhO family protein [bacterium]
ELKQSLDLQSTRFLTSDLPIIHPDLIEIESIDFNKPYDHLLYLSNSNTQRIKAKKAILYENKKYFPRINITPQANAVYMLPDDKYGTNILNQILDSEFDPTITTIIEDAQRVKNAPPSSDENKTNNNATFKVIEYSPAKFIIKYTANSPSILQISDTYYPGWNASVDQEEIKVHKANFAFKAVEIPSGSHTVTFSFTPTYWDIGTKIAKAALATIGILAFIYILLFIKNKNQIKK